MKKLLPGLLLTFAAIFGVYSCASSDITQQENDQPTIQPLSEIERPSPDPRVGLQAGLFDAEETIWNLNLLSATPPPEAFLGSWGTDLAFKDNYAIQGNYDGFIVWNISDPANPEVAIDFKCPASQSDVSVYGDLLFVSGEGLGGRLDCGTEGVRETVSADRLRGIRIFDISDMYNPEYIANVQTCRGSHTHSVLVDPNDDENVYVYVSGSAPVRPEEELPGCTTAFPDEDPDSPLFRIEVIKVPLANPQDAAIANSPRIFDGLEAPPVRELTAEEQERIEQAREQGRFVGEMMGRERVIPNGMARGFLQRLVSERDGEGEPTAADSAALQERLPEFIDEMLAARGRGSEALGPNQCHDITLYPEIGLAGGACEGLGLLLDISDPVNPVRIDAVADSNFSYWHSATFNNDGTTVLFTDEWGGGTQPKCREEDPYEWGANAIYSIENGEMVFQSYFKMDAPQTETENCVAHNGSMIPIPDRDIMVQSWYQGGINVFDFTDPKNPVEIAFHDRGPISAERVETGGSWSIYWYNGYLVNSEIARGLDIFELVPSEFITQNEIDAMHTVSMDYFNPQGQPKYSFPSSFALAKAYLDQLERNRELDISAINSIRRGVQEAENTNGSAQRRMLTELAGELENHAGSSSNGDKVTKIANTLRDLASAS
ncbi:hypothetical protein DYD21_00780 [Rhodohalobacter sp. SW132]|uniref:LVIVD repeat-containing protein n=1 Tax=Rhodohalobacter sp. SW132 TaxID=2293433 RepID=UPI000E3ADE3F|nr:hypothetical protein [Rhodohalobacter sp. SW132]REL38515.1 hypothetical protein DYD21_00780 [Rhodohalobacter sp. SW132]